MSINDLVRFEGLGLLTNSPRWSAVTGWSASGLTFAGTADAVAIVTSSGTYRAVRGDVSPTSPNQRVEFTWTYDASVTVGLLLRVVDTNNYVLASVTGAGSLVVQEYVSGVPTTICTVANPGMPNNQATIRVELVGKRCRAWFEAATEILDRPPDAGGNVSNATNVGQWGIYMSAGGANAAKITRFAAANLPSAVLAAPTQVSLAGASGFNLTPVQLSVSGLTSPWFIDWEVLQVDWSDIPEPYRSRTVGSITSHVAWVRPGYNYDVRARGVGGPNGAEPGPWTDYVRVSAIGSPGGTGQATQQVQQTYWPEMPWSDPGSAGPPTGVTFAHYLMPGTNPDWVLECTDTAMPSSVVSTNGRESVASRSVRPRQSFKFEYTHRTNDEYQTLIDFFEQMQSQNIAFNWTHPLTGVIYTLRFSEDSYTTVYDDQNSASPSPITSLSFNVIEAAVNVVPATLPVQLIADPALT